MNQTDFIIIGAGPAGCAAAIRARQAGLSVLMFDINPHPKVVPGETFHPGIEPIFKQLGILDQILAAGFKRHLGVYVQKGTQREFLPYGEDQDGPWLGFQVDRRMFHQILQHAAIKAGISLIRSAAPSSVLMNADRRVIGVEVNGSKYLANWTVDATGRSAWLAQKLGLKAQVRSPMMKARFGWHTGSNAEEDAPLFFFRENGWDWQAPLGNQIAWVELRLAALDRLTPSGIDLTWKYQPKCAGPGFFLLGDAAATLDPSSSHGVLRALMSGVLCSYLVQGLQNNDLAAAEAIQKYQEWLSTQFEQDERLLREHYLDSPVGDQFFEWINSHQDLA